MLILYAPLPMPGRGGPRPAVDSAMMAMPMGLVAIAAHLAEAGVPVEIVHVGVERVIDPAFDPVAEVERLDAAVVMISLHWHYVTRPALDLAAAIKARRPHTTVVMGGLTASLFAEELLDSFPAVDFVVRGDGEEPARRLLDALGRGAEALAAVPNLWWRRGGVARLNPGTWHLDAAGAATLRHGALEHLRHARTYLEHGADADFDRPPAASPQPAFFYNPGRGCPVQCSCCGGGAQASLLTGHAGSFFYPPTKVARDLAGAWAAGARAWRTSFDPRVRRSEVVAILAAEAAAARRWELVFSCWSLPTDELLEAIAAHAAPGSAVILSPDCGDEELRRRHRGFPFTNTALCDAVAAARRRDLAVFVFFAVGVPGETEATIGRTAALAAETRRLGAEVRVLLMSLDPGSPLHQDPGAHGAHLRVRTLMDFYRVAPLDPGPYYHTDELSEGALRAAVRRLRSVARG
ncbi:MAG TPA: cobalamin-dependent protein [Polyangia bacterium]